jgi:hypothetical protein
MVSRDLSGPDPVLTDLSHLDDLADEEEVRPPPATAPPRLEGPANSNRSAA